MAIEPTPLAHAGAQPGAAARTAQAEAPTTALEADVQVSVALPVFVCFAANGLFPFTQDEGNDNSDGDSALHVVRSSLYPLLQQTCHSAHRADLVVDTPNRAAMELVRPIRWHRAS